jgi:hypothetical protein
MSQLDLEFIGIILAQIVFYSPIIKIIVDINKINK